LKKLKFKKSDLILIFSVYVFKNNLVCKALCLILSSTNSKLSLVILFSAVIHSRC